MDMKVTKHTRGRLIVRKQYDGDHLLHVYYHRADGLHLQVHANGGARLYWPNGDTLQFSREQWQPGKRDRWSFDERIKDQVFAMLRRDLNEQR